MRRHVVRALADLKKELGILIEKYQDQEAKAILQKEAGTK